MLIASTVRQRAFQCSVSPLIVFAGIDHHSHTYFLPAQQAALALSPRHRSRFVSRLDSSSLSRRLPIALLGCPHQEDLETRDCASTRTEQAPSSSAAEDGDAALDPDPGASARELGVLDRVALKVFDHLADARSRSPRRLVSSAYPPFRHAVYTVTVASDACPRFCCAISIGKPSAMAWLAWLCRSNGWSPCANVSPRQNASPLAALANKHPRLLPVKG